MDPQYITEADIDFVEEIESEDELALHCREEDSTFEETYQAVIREERARA